MGIVYNKVTQEFHLYNNNISYIIKILKNKQLGHLYFGKRIRQRDSFSHLLEMVHRPMTSYVYEGDSYFSLDHIKQEYPSYGTTDFKHPAVEIKQQNGSRITNFEYISHKIYSGKPRLNGLPATYVEESNEADTLEIKLYDSLINVELVLAYTIYSELDSITRSSRFINKGTEEVDLTIAMSMCLDLPDCDYEFIQLSGAWSRERYVKKRMLEQD